MVRLSSPFSSVVERDACPCGGVKASPMVHVSEFRTVRARFFPMINASRYKRPVGIAFEEFNHDLHPDPRNELLAPSLAGPRLRNPDRAGLLGLAIAIELQPEVAVFVGRYLLLFLVLLVHDL